MSIVTARKLIFLTFFLILAGIIYLFSTSSARAFTGSGTEEDPYHLQDCNDLLQINNHLSSHFIIDGSYGCAGENFPVARQMTGNSLANGFQGFSGVLDGNGNTITYTSTNQPSSTSTTHYLGFLGYINGGTVKNLTLQTFAPTAGESFLGVLAARAKDATLENISSSSAVTGTGNFVGGLVGLLEGNSTYSNLTYTGTLTGGTGEDERFGNVIAPPDEGQEGVVAPLLATGNTSNISLIEDTFRISVTFSGEIVNTGGGNAHTRGFRFATAPGGYSGATSAGWTAQISGNFGTGSYQLINVNLRCGKTYYYIAYAINSAGEGRGAEKSFTGPDCPPDENPPATPSKPSTDSPTTDTTPTWSWSFSFDQETGLADPAYTVEWSQDPDFSDGVSSATAASNSFTHSTPLSAGTWYFRVLASDLAGNDSDYSQTGSVVIEAEEEPIEDEDEDADEEDENPPSDNSSNNNNTSQNTSNTTGFGQAPTVDISETDQEDESETADSEDSLSIPATFDLTITVTDQNGNLVEGARVELYSNPRVAYTDASGKVTFPAVEKGEHRLLVFYRDQKVETSIWSGPKPGQVWASEGNEQNITVNLPPSTESSVKGIKELLKGIIMGVLGTCLVFWLVSRKKIKRA